MAPYFLLLQAAALLALSSAALALPQATAPPTPAQPPQPQTPATQAPAPPPASAAPEAEQAIISARAKVTSLDSAGKGKSPEMAQALNDLISAELDTEKATSATLDEAVRELSIAEAASGKRSKAYVAALSDNSEVRVALGRHAEARPYAEQALEIARAEFPDSEEGINASDELAFVCLHLSDLACSRRADETAIAIERKPGPDHDWDLAYTLSNYTDVLRHLGDEKASGAAAEECLAAALRSKPNDPHVGIFETALGAHYMRIQDFPRAILHFNAAVDRLSKTYGPHGAWVMQVSADLASVYSRTGQFKQAWQTFEFALRDENAPFDDKADQHAEFARSLAAGGDLSRAITEGLLANRMGRDSFTLQARLLPERQALAYERRRAHGLDTAMSVLVRHRDLPSTDVYEEMLNSRALVADEMARRQRNLNAANDPAIAGLLDQLNKARANLLSLEQKPGGSDDSALIAATARMEAIERELAERSLLLRQDQAVASAGIADLRRNLPSRAVLVSYWSFRRRSVEKVDPSRSDSPSYIAFVLRPDSAQPRVIDLGDARPIEDAVIRMRASANSEAHAGGLGSARNERAYREAGSQLRTLVWDPLQTAVGDSHLVILVPDGMLNLVPFASLPRGSGYLADGPQVIHTLSSERDLLSPSASAHRSGLLAIGSPQFDSPDSPASATASLATPTLRDAPAPCNALEKLAFSPLDGAALEVRDIHSTWQRHNPAEPATLFTGSLATRDRFLEAAPHSRVLHVATHAFVLDRGCGDGNPLLHSGLVFAGANRDRQASILTAQQIASIDLSGVDWAVLSACNTGGGVLSDGEGVLGLQRAFHIAGVRSVVMTLWPVDDQVTARFMHQLYNQRLVHRASTPDAVWTSTRALLAQRRAAGQNTHPWYWAGYIGSGWEPLTPPVATLASAQ